MIKVRTEVTGKEIV